MEKESNARFQFMQEELRIFEETLDELGRNIYKCQESGSSTYFYFSEKNMNTTTQTDQEFKVQNIEVKKPKLLPKPKLYPKPMKKVEI